MPRKLLKRHYLVRGLRIFGAPVYLHVSAIVAAVLLGLSAVKSPIFGIIAIASYLFIIVVHEVGHAFVADRLGLHVLNIQIGWIHGVCEYEGSHNEWRAILVAWGGVAAQAVIAIFVLTIAAVIPGEDLGYFGPVVVFLGYLNLMVAAVNLAPSRELDGAIAWRILPYMFRTGMFRNSRRRTRRRKARDKARS